MKKYKEAMVLAILSAIPDMAVEFELLNRNPSAGDRHIIPAIKKILESFDEAFLLLDEQEHQMLVRGIFFPPETSLVAASRSIFGKTIDWNVYVLRISVIQKFEHLADDCWREFQTWEKYKDAVDYAMAEKMMKESYAI